MRDISREYVVLFNAITDAAEILENLRIRLQLVQQQTEELYLEGESAEVVPLKPAS